MLLVLVLVFCSTKKRVLLLSLARQLLLTITL
jgi:hypothetical protein